MLWSLALFGFVLASAQGRAVNISNTWVLPEEGFPVFYRYFRDRISWYEADAVCQFHHANLVTVDTTAQYDAVRAYLKELDISSAVWVGLIRSNPDGDFTWTDYRGLSRDGYWSSAPDPRAAPLCAAADPAADYRWEARACGGPTVASFICELPVPQWALGNEGCMVRALPALTVLYLPESAAVQLTADCGLAGVKRVQCTGNVQREDLLRGLSCAEDDMQSSTLSAGATSSSPSPVSSDSPFTDQDLISEISTEDNVTTEHEDDINQSSTTKPTVAPESVRPEYTAMQNIKNLNKVFMNKNIDLAYNFNNNLQSNVIPKIAGSDNYLTSDLSEKLEDEKHMQHKMLHDEIARHGNFETIFTQPTDHFVPPLVMAKAKISDDMTVLSLKEKHAQQLSEQRYMKYYHDDSLALENKLLTSPADKDELHKADVADKPLITTTSPITTEDNVKKDVVKTSIPKKYSGKQYGLKSKTFKVMDNKSFKPEKTTESFSPATERASTDLKTTTPKNIDYTPHINTFEEQPTLDLTVIIKESNLENNKNKALNSSSEIPKIEIVQNDMSITEPVIKLSNKQNKNGEVTQEISVNLPTTSVKNFTLAHEIIKITILKEENSSEALTVFDVTTKTPIFDDNTFETTTVPLFQDSANETMKNKSATGDSVSTKIISEKTTESTVSTVSDEVNTSVNQEPQVTKKEIHDTKTTYSEEILTTTISTPVTLFISDNITDIINTTNQLTTDNSASRTELHTEEDNIEANATDTSETIDDFDSPLLSGANEPVHKPNRSRRPQPANRINKFNPFRILG